MESAAGRGGAVLPMPPSQSARKEWRAVTEHSVRNAGNEEMERSKTDERTIYEHGTEPLEVDFCAITIEGSGNLNNDLLNISRRREELQQMEIELRAQVIARSEILEMQKSFDAQIKEQANTNSKLKEQLQEREQCIHELEMKMEEKDRELRAIRIDSEAAWAKEDLLREQNKELASFRRERDNSEAERAQHLKQIHDLKEHIQGKESQFLELEEQHRAAQEAIIIKDEQLREAQVWVQRAQEMDALHSTTNHSLQAELRDRTEQFNQFWLGCQRQFAEMERHHLQTIQQLQLELAEARERNGIYTEDSRMALSNSKDVAPYVQNNGNQFSVNESGTLNGNSGIIPNGNLDGAPPFVSSGNGSTKTDHAPGVPVVPSSIIGMGAFLPPGQVPTLHSFVMHQQAVPHSVTPANSPIPQSHVGHFQSTPSISSHQHLQSKQVIAESSQAPNQTQYKPSQTEQNHVRTDAHYDYELPADGHVHSDYLNAHLNSQQRSSPLIGASSEELQVIGTNDKQYLLPPGLEQNLQESSSQLHDTLKSDLPDQMSEPKANLENQAPKLADTSRGQESGSLSSQPGGENNTIGATKQLQGQSLAAEPWKSSDVPSSTSTKNQGSSADVPESNSTGVTLPEVPISAGWSSTSVTAGKTSKPTLLDERSLLACIVRAIPSGASGRIRISTTLPNRLGKMLAPLHWHDYKKQYGKLDDFVVRHPELFVIEGDFIHLREGAQEIISATTAAAKVAAAASAPYSSSLPSVAVTPVAQPYRLKKVPTGDANPGKTSLSAEGASAGNTADGRPSQLLAIQDKHSNGVGLNIPQGLSNVKILSKSKDIQEPNGFSSETGHGHSSVHMTVGNGANPGMATLHNKGSSNGKHRTNMGGKQQGRATGAGLTTRR
ncbi:hypothetical protein AAC387_Pa06g1260 [Persea americana]